MYLLFDIGILHNDVIIRYVLFRSFLLDYKLLVKMTFIKHQHAEWNCQLLILYDFQRKMAHGSAMDKNMNKVRKVPIYNICIGTPIS